MRVAGVFFRRLCFVLAAGAGSSAAALSAFALDAPQAPVAAALTPLERLGQHIFEDKTLSRPAGVSCASCHDPAKAFQGNNGSPVAAVARGSKPDSLGARKTPSLMYASFAPPFAFVDKKDEKTGKVEKAPVGGQFHDGRAATLLQQFEGPLLNPLEMNNPSKRAATENIRDGAFADLAREVYGKDVFVNLDAAFDKIALAVVAFESSARFHPFASRFDEFLRGRARLSAREARGFVLFRNPRKGNCIACHAGDEKSHEPKNWLFTDYSYDALGAPRNGAILANKDAGVFDLGLCRREGLEKIAPQGFDIDSVCGAFKVPTLRNVARTAPYMHNGAFATLRDAVAFYATRDTSPARWYPKGADEHVAKYNDLPEKYRANVNEKEVPYDRKQGKEPRLNEHEIDAIVAFLNTLTDPPQQ
jgi:cytochrome c peroxidase